jgi:hypothetical protein
MRYGTNSGNFPAGWKLRYSSVSLKPFVVPDPGKYLSSLPTVLAFIYVGLPTTLSMMQYWTRAQQSQSLGFHKRMHI